MIEDPQCDMVLRHLIGSGNLVLLEETGEVRCKSGAVPQL